MNTPPRLRTIPECIRQLKADDENSAITICCLRRWVRENSISVIRVSSKVLVNYDLLLEKLSNPDCTNPADDTGKNKIRRIG